jgi:hypothetical protein
MLPQHIPSAVTLSEEGVERLKVSFPSTVLLLPYSQMGARRCDFSSCTLCGLPNGTGIVTLFDGTAATPPDPGGLRGAINEAADPSPRGGGASHSSIHAVSAVYTVHALAC